jgi:hypothetical protein
MTVLAKQATEINGKTSNQDQWQNKQPRSIDSIDSANLTMTFYRLNAPIEP